MEREKEKKNGGEDREITLHLPGSFSKLSQQRCNRFLLHPHPPPPPPPTFSFFSSTRSPVFDVRSKAAVIFFFFFSPSSFSLSGGREHGSAECHVVLG